jgi:hypothetical protein
MITRGAVSASTPSPACHHDNTPYTPTLPTPWYSAEPESAIAGVAWVLRAFGGGVRAKSPVEQTGSVGYAFARILRGRH